MALISVIVPLYNVEKYLERCLDSILNQTFEDFDMILVDDGSSDGSIEICDRYAEKDGRISVIHQKNAGQASARNKGLDWCFGESDSKWIVFVDSDDWIHRDYLKSLLNAAIDNNTDISACDFIKVSEQAEDISDISSPVLCLSKDFVLNNFLNSIVPWGKLYKKECFSSIRYPLGMKHEDEFVTYKILLGTEKIAFIKSNMYYYFTNLNSVSYSVWTPDELKSCEAFDEKLEYLKERGFSELYEWQLEHYMYFLCDSCKYIIESGNGDYKIKYLSDARKKLRKIIKQFEKTRGKVLERDKIWVKQTAYPREMAVYWFFKGIAGRFSK